MNKNKMKQLRMDAGVSISEALEHLNISYSMLSKIERNDRSPGTIVIPKMSQLYDCSIDKIFEAMEETKALEKLEGENERDKETNEVYKQ